MIVDRVETRTAVVAAGWSLAVAVLVFAFKIAAWWVTGSVALYSDALESIVNIAAAGLALFALRYSARPADHNHPYGHSKIEYVSAVVEGGLIVAAAAAIIVAAVGRLREPAALELGPLGIACALIATAVNAVLAAFLIRTGTRHRSPALVADGRHVLTDVVTSVGVLAGLGIAWAIEAWIVDPLIAIAVAANIVWVGWRVIRHSFGGLMDEGLDPGTIAGLQAALEGAMGEAIEVHALRTRPAGPSTFVEFHLVVPSSMTVERAHTLCDRLEEVVRREIPGAQPLIHVEPEDHAERVLRRETQGR